MRRFLLLLLPLLVATSPGFAAENVGEPKLSRRVAPEFTAELKRRWPANLSEGAVTIDFIVDARGNVAATHVARARIREMVAPALTALGKWKFKPATANGKAAPALMRAEIWFWVSGKRTTPGQDPEPTFLALGDALHLTDAAPDPAELYVATDASRHLTALRPHLPISLRTGDPAGKTLIEPCATLMPLPVVPREILEKAGGWIKFRVATVVHPDGSPGDHYIISSTAPAANRAMAAAMARWGFVPGTVNGKAASFLVATDYEIGEIVTMDLAGENAAK